jgi:DNA-binding LacI/PurR family transcriptional regulator
LRQGYTHLSLFAPFKAEFAEKRLIGIKQAFDKSGLPASSLTLSDCVDHGDTFEIDHDSVAFEAAPRFLSQKKEKWGIIAANDPCAYGLLAAASEMGLVAGKDFGLVGFDDRPHSRELGLTSVHPPVHQMGVEAGKLIRQALRGEALPLQVLLKSQIVARKSSPAL